MRHTPLWRCTFWNTHVPFAVTVSVKNTRKVSAAEVVQMYVGSKGAIKSKDRSVRLLKGFRGMELDLGKGKTIKIAGSNEDK